MRVWCGFIAFILYIFGVYFLYSSIVGGGDSKVAVIMLVGAIFFTLCRLYIEENDYVEGLSNKKAELKREIRDLKK